MDVLEMADVFVTHGGMNSVSEALITNTPMVIIPFVSDQPVNAHCMEKLGVGKKLEYSDVKKDTLKNVVLSVMMDNDIKSNLSKVQELIQSAPGNRGGAEFILKSTISCETK